MAEKRVFPMTVWPGSVVPVPALLLPQVRLVKRQALLFGSTAKPGDEKTDWEIAELPPEFYLREFLELETSDSEVVLAFCQRWGPVGNYDCTDLADLPFAGRFAREADGKMPLPWHPGRPPVEAETRKRSMWRAGLRQLTEVHSVGRVGIYQDALRNMVLLWRFISGDIGAAELAEEARPPHGHPYLGLSRDRLRNLEISRASFELVTQLNWALTPFHVSTRAANMNEYAPVAACRCSPTSIRPSPGCAVRQSQSRQEELCTWRERCLALERALPGVGASGTCAPFEAAFRRAELQLTGSRDGLLLIYTTPEERDRRRRRERDSQDVQSHAGRRLDEMLLETTEES